MSVESSSAVRIAQRYTLRRLIAAGGMGEVHLATDERLGRLVAVKVLAAGYADSPDFVERFRREALTAAALSHPNIAQVYDYGVDGASHFIVMEYAEGQDLAHVIRERGRLTPSDAVRVAEQVCAALAAAHRAGVVHRDIKPGNVIVRADGTVKVTDFGIARALGQASLTDTGMVMGTAAYIAPEQARGQATTPSSDLYSVGILLFQMLTGAVPFDGDTPVAIAMRHLDEPVPLPSSRVADLPADLDDVVVRATAKSPADRFPDADAMAAALRAHETRADDATAALPAAEATSMLAPATSTSVLPTAAGPERAGASRPGPSRPGPSRPAASRPAASHPAAPVPASAGGEARRPDTMPTAMTRRSVADARRRSRPGALVWVLAAVVVALVVTLGFVMLSGHDPVTTPATAASPSSSAPAPSTAPATTAPTSDGSSVPAGLVGQQRTDAVAQLIRLGVDVRWVLVRSTQPDGAVLGSYPAPGQPMTKGQTVALVVSRGHAPDAVNSSFVVPDGLVGATAEDAAKGLGGTDVRVTRVTVPAPGDAGRVIATWPSAGTRTPDGVVVLVVSGDPRGGSSSGDH